jgi:hypothetical protein
LVASDWPWDGAASGESGWVEPAAGAAIVASRLVLFGVAVVAPPDNVNASAAIAAAGKYPFIKMLGSRGLPISTRGGRFGSPAGHIYA